ncbi:aldehyde dehydrogenase family protein [Sphingobium indicum]|nr:MULTISPECIES: aldehyde dehydrogenase family protein [Sphingobium]
MQPGGLARYGQLVGGEIVTGERDMEVLSPATEAAFAIVPDATRGELARAIAAAGAAFPAWRALSFDQRRACLLDFAAAILRDRDRIAEALTREQGKPLSRALSEIGNAVRAIEDICTIDMKSQMLRDTPTEKIELVYRPLGVVAGITAWNVPVILAAQKIAQALYTGNTMVLKPSPYTPVATLLLGEASLGILPPGVLNIVSGGNELGAWLTSDPAIAKISFTGSGPTGRRVLEASASNFARVTLELGGNDAAIVLPDVDLDKVVPALFAAAFNNAGQICMAIKRLYVHADIHDEVVRRFARLADEIRLGDGMLPDSEMGPVQNRAQYEKLLDLLADTRAIPGAHIVAGGVAPEGAGYFIRPTVVTGLVEGCRLVDEEPFGPILPILRFDDADDAVERANASQFGLSGSVWSADTARAAALARRLEVGTAWVNRHGGADGGIPLGGAKASGIGREHGLLGLRNYMEPQIVSVPQVAVSPC